MVLERAASLGQSVLFDNRAGASGAISAEHDEIEVRFGSGADIAGWSWHVRYPRKRTSFACLPVMIRPVGIRTRSGWSDFH